jgi:crossover junction endodeoxyribonuclease RuvC
MTRFDHVVGLDLSLTSTGLARTSPVSDHAFAEVLTVKSSGTKADTWEQRHMRLHRLVDAIDCKIPRRSLVMLEAPAYSRTTGSQHDRSGLWWMVYAAVVAGGMTVVPIGPTVRAKYATGKGNASKDAVLAAAVRRYPDIDISGNDIADAVILMAIGCRLLGKPIDDMPATHRAALDKVQLPEEVAA